MSDLASVLERARNQLLDLSARNRLLNAPRRRPRAAVIEVEGGRSEEVFRLLVGDGKTLGFRPRVEPAADEGDDGDDQALALPPPDEIGAAGAPPRHRLQTGLGPERLQSRLLRLHYDGRSALEERGVNALHLALGFLEWYEAPAASEPRFAPLLLIPVRLERGSASERFRLAWSGDEILPNISLVEKLRRELRLEIPGFADGEELVPGDYLAAIASAVAAEPRFRVHADEITLGLFSFTKLLMWRDLDPKAWPAEAGLEGRELLRAVALDGFRAEPEGLPDDRCLDDLVPALDQVHVLDADSFQARAIEEVRRGRNLLIQGPPGTGKSQTIANLIASAVKASKRVLFVAEKMAALEVVKRRLDGIDLGAMCLELHSHKANKRALLEELRRTSQLARPRGDDPQALAARLQAARDRLNAHADALHTPIGPSGLTPRDLIGRLVAMGGRPGAAAGIALPGAAGWSAAEIEERRQIVQDIARRAERLGTPAIRHAWRGVRLTAVMPSESGRVRQLADRIVRSVGGLRRVVAGLRDALGSTDAADTPAEIMRLLDTCEYLASAPARLDVEALSNPVWSSEREVLARLGTAARSLSETRASLAGAVAAEAWTCDLAPTRHALARWGRSPWRLLVPAWHRARRRLADLAVLPLPGTLDEQLALLDRLILAREARAALERGEELGREAFGAVWCGSEPDWFAIATIERWERDGRDPGLLPEAPRLLALVADADRLGALAGQTGLLLQSIEEICRELFTALDLDAQEAFGATDLRLLPLDLVTRRLRGWLADPEGLELWIAWRRGAARARSLRLGPLVEALHKGELAAADAADAFEAAVCETLLREALQARPTLADLDGLAQGGLVERFRGLDLERITLARAEVARAHHAGLPPSNPVLQREFAKKRRHLPIRSLLSRAGEAVQGIKPVFMMSPLSVAEFLAPGAVQFDLLLIDEASQVEPVDALGAIARASQLVVVGDDKQLPPSPFFKGALADDDEPPDDEVPSADIESILGLCAAQGMPQRMLRWHYRSRHPSLIALSNREFYDSRLHIVPSPFADDPDLGLAFHHLPGAPYDRGGSRTNREEAKRVAQAVLAHARTRPDLSLGVGCFSIAQRDAILAELERLWRAAPELRPFFREDGAEPFFVKNLETIQGDERDVILVSIGYGRDASGHLALAFGPLNADGGERRLNVLITRARRRLEVFSAITAADIDLARAGKPGVAALKAFLQYAESGVLGVAEATGRGPDSLFESEVARVIEGQGHRVDLQVGAAGFFVDLAVRDPERPGRWLLGVECDGAAWHSALSARDRDRLRQQVLEDQGWIIHRIWSTDWYRRPEAEQRRLGQAITAARATWDRRDRELRDRATLAAVDAA